MSSTLMWRPDVPLTGKSLSDELKKTISRKLWDTDGSMGGGDAMLTINDIPYVEGLRDAGVIGAEELVEILIKHHSIILWHEN